MRSQRSSVDSKQGQAVGRADTNGDGVSVGASTWPRTGKQVCSN